MLMRKAASKLMAGKPEDSLQLHYYSQIINHSPFIIGDTYQVAEFKGSSFPCLVTEQKLSYPGLYIKAEDFLVLGKLINDDSAFQISVVVKAKHIHAEEKNKELRVTIREFDSHEEQTVENRFLKLKG
jgi:hypothetical protein